MKTTRSQSIKKLAIMFVLLAFSLLVVSYAILVNFFFGKGLELSVQHRLELEAATYAKAYADNPGAGLPEAANFRTYAGYASLPRYIKARRTPEELPEDVFAIVRPGDADDGEHAFIYPWRRADGEILYFTYSLGPEDKSEDIHAALRTSLSSILIVGGASFAGVLCIAWLLMRRVAGLITRLTDWAFQLNAATIDAPVEDFQYVELNRLAGVFRANMRRFLESARRERKFLRNASHELRTPIAVLQTNLDWLSRLGAGKEERFKKPLGGMRNAVNNMKALVRTLLLVNKKDAEALAAEEIAADALLREIIEENAYLLEKKNVLVRQTLASRIIAAPRPLARIIWSNIVRNAFQHADEGTIDIVLSDEALTVANALAGDDAGPSPDSYGLGLMLIQDLTANLGWTLTTEESPRSYRAILRM